MNHIHLQVSLRRIKRQVIGPIYYYSTVYRTLLQYFGPVLVKTQLWSLSVRVEGRGVLHYQSLYNIDLLYPRATDEPEACSRSVPADRNLLRFLIRSMNIRLCIQLTPNQCGKNLHVSQNALPFNLRNL